MVTRRRFFGIIGIGALATLLPTKKATSIGVGTDDLSWRVNKLREIDRMSIMDAVKAGPLREHEHINIADVSIPSYIEGKFDPDREYARCIVFDNFFDYKPMSLQLLLDASRVLPSGIQYELRLAPPPFNFHDPRDKEMSWIESPCQKMGWIYLPEMMHHDSAYDIDPRFWRFIPACQCYIRGRFLV